MKKSIIAIIVLFLFSFCEKEYSAENLNPIPACSVFYDWSVQSVPNFQGNCYLVTNAQIRWMQQNSLFVNSTLAPNNNECPTKSQLITYAGGIGNILYDSNFENLSSNNAVPIGYFIGNLS